MDTEQLVDVLQITLVWVVTDVRFVQISVAYLQLQLQCALIIRKLQHCVTKVDVALVITALLV